MSAAPRQLTTALPTLQTALQTFAPQFIQYLISFMVLMPLMLIFTLMPLMLILPMINMFKAVGEALSK